MKSIEQLITIIRPDLSSSLEGKEKELYSLIREGKIKTEKQGADLFFKEHRHQYKYFNKLKNDLKKSLRGYLLITPLENTATEYTKAYDASYKAGTEVKLLLIRGATKEAISIAKQYLDQAIKYDIHRMAYSLAEDLQYHTAFYQRQLKEAQEYDVIAKSQLEMIVIENEVRTYIGIIASKINYSSTPSKEFQIELNNYYNRIKSYPKYKSASINMYAYNIAIIRHYAYFDYPKIIEVCQEANAFFLQSNHPNRRYSFLYKIVPALIALNRYEEARSYINDAIDISSHGSVNWSICNYYSLLLCFHEQNYQEAYTLYQGAKKHSAKIFRSLGEDWLIIKAYLSFFVKTEKIQTEQQEYFKLSKFLNDLPISSKDKGGNNINVLIIQILHLIEGKKGKLIDVAENFEKYIRRHLKDEALLRAKIFLSMLLAIPKSKYHRAAVLRNTEKSFQKLKTIPARAGQNLDIEIVPYEILWNEVLDLLENRFVKGLKRKKK